MSCTRLQIPRICKIWPWKKKRTGLSAEYINKSPKINMEASGCPTAAARNEKIVFMSPKHPNDRVFNWINWMRKVILDEKVWPESCSLFLGKIWPTGQSMSNRFHRWPRKILSVVPIGSCNAARCHDSVAGVHHADVFSTWRVQWRKSTRNMAFAAFTTMSGKTCGK